MFIVASAVWGLGGGGVCGGGRCSNMCCQTILPQLQPKGCIQSWMPRRPFRRRRWYPRYRSNIICGPPRSPAVLRPRLHLFFFFIALLSGSGTHKSFDVCIATWKAFHNDLPGAYGVNEDVKVFSAADGDMAEQIKAFIAEKANSDYVNPTHSEL